MSDPPGASLWNPRDAFAEVVRAPDERIDLARSALLIAAYGLVVAALALYGLRVQAQRRAQLRRSPPIADPREG